MKRSVLALWRHAPVTAAVLMALLAGVHAQTKTPAAPPAAVLTSMPRASGTSPAAGAIAKPELSPAMSRVEDAIEAGQPRGSKATLDTMPSQDKDAAYYLLLGRCHSSGADEGIAMGAFKTAIQRSPMLIDAHLQLVACLARQGLYRDAMDAYEKGVRLAGGSDPRFPFVFAMMAAKTGEWELCQTALELAATSYAAPGPTAKTYLQRVKNYLLQARRVLDPIAETQDKIDTAEKDLAAAKKDGLAALGDKDELRRQYEQRRRDINDTFKEGLRSADRQRDSDMPPESLRKSNQNEYDRQVARANDRCAAAKSVVKQTADKSYADLDAATKPKVEAIDAKIKALEQKVVNLQKTIETAKARAKELAASIARIEKPFDPQAELKLVAVNVLSGAPVTSGQIKPTSQPD